MSGKKKSPNALAEWIGSHNLTTGAQIRGPVWRGPLPRRPHYSTGYTPAHAEANEAIEQKRHPAMGFMPDSGLGRILTDRRVTRSLRRALLAVVQGAKTPARDRLERSVERRLTALGITPS